MKKYLIYKHTLLIGKRAGWSYIGLTSQNPEKRWAAGLGYQNQKKFYRAIKKYGWENFSHEILFNNLTLDKANFLEKELIIKYNSRIKGFNSDDGGNGSAGHTVSITAKKQMSEAHKGKKLSEEQKQKISQANKGKKHGPMTAAHKLKLSKAHKGKKMSDSFKQKQSILHVGKSGGMQGHHHTEATKQKMSLSKKGKKLSDEHKQHISHATIGKVISQQIRQKMSQASPCKKVIICIETAEIFESVTAAAKKYNIAKASISACLHKKRATAGGFHWKFCE